MNWQNKESRFWVSGIVLTLIVGGIGYLSAQTTPTPNSTAVSYGTTPVPTSIHKNKNLMTSNKIPNEGTPPGGPIDGENPTLTLVPEGTVVPAPKSTVQVPM